MNAPQQIGIEGDVETRMQEALQAQRESYLKEGAVSAETRIDRIDRAIDVLVRYGEKVSDALNSDFTCRPREVNMLTDVVGSIGAMKHAKKHLRKWMKPEKRPTVFPLNLLGGRSRIEYQPKGVVGVVAPWNFPVSMVFHPMSGILAAGNRVMIKPSEFTPATSEVIAEMIADVFDPNGLAMKLFDQHQASTGWAIELVLNMPAFQGCPLFGLQTVDVGRFQNLEFHSDVKIQYLAHILCLVLEVFLLVGEALDWRAK